MKPRPLVLLGLLSVVLAVVAWLGMAGYRTATDARLALADLDRLQAAAEKPSLAALPAWQADLAALEAHLVEVQAHGRPFLWLAPRLGWLPRFGRDAVAAPALLEMAAQAAAAGRGAVDALVPLAGVLADGGGLDSLPALAQGLRDAAPALAEAQTRLAVAGRARAAIREPLDPRLQRQLDRIDRLLPAAEAGLQMAAMAPGLLGMDGPRTYLILAQNSHELRATGGFISGVGVVAFDGGRITQLNVRDSYAADNWDQPHPAPPQPLSEQMGLQLWTVRDANWSPDFGQASEVARALYAQDQGVTTDGAIAVDLEAVRMLVGILGPLEVPGIDEPVTAANTIQWMKQAWQSPTTTAATVQSPQRREWLESRKDFMGELMAAALIRLERGADLDLIALAQTLLQMLERRHLQVSMDDPTVAALLAARGWDGGLRPPKDSDFLAVIDSNVGFNKVNAVVRPALHYSVGRQEAALIATLVISYTHSAPAGAEPACNRFPRYGDSYDEMTRRCYWNYLRVYVPGGSELLATEGLKKTATELGERGTTIFAGDFVMSPGETHTVTLRYRLPAGLPTVPYRLFVRKQAGTDAIPLIVEALGHRWETDLREDRAFVAEGQ